MWTVVLRSQRTVTSSSGKWTTVKYPAGQMNILCFLSTMLDGFCKQTSASISDMLECYSWVNSKIRWNSKSCCKYCYWSLKIYWKQLLLASRCHHQTLRRICRCWSAEISCRWLRCGNSQRSQLLHWTSHQRCSVEESKHYHRNKPLQFRNVEC